MELVPEYTSHFAKTPDTQNIQALTPEEDDEVEKLMQRFRMGNRL
jgi:hypothetical protein